MEERLYAALVQNRGVTPLLQRGASDLAIYGGSIRVTQCGRFHQARGNTDSGPSI